MVLQLADQGNGRVIHQELGVSAVGGFQRVDQFDQIIHRNGGCTSGSDTNLTTAFGKDTGRLTGAGADAECLLLSNTKSTGKLLGNVGFQVECAVLEQFGADLHQVGELVGVYLLLGKGGIALRVGSVFRCPLSHRMGCSNGNLALSTGSDYLRQRTDHIGFIQCGNNRGLELLRYKVAAVCVYTCTEDIVNKLLAAQMQTKVLTVCVGSSAGFILGSVLGLFGEGLTHGLFQFRFNGVSAFHSADFIGQVVQFLFHVVVGVVVLGGENTFCSAVGIQESLHGSPQLGALIAHFYDSHIRITSVT